MKNIAIAEIATLSTMFGISVACLFLSGCGEMYATLGHRPVQTWHESKSYNSSKSRPLKCWFISCPEYTNKENEEIQGS